MAEIAGFPEAFAAALAEVAPVLDERARRLLLGAGARQLGRGGIKLIAAATGAAADTVGKGAAKLEAEIVAGVGRLVDRSARCLCESVACSVAGRDVRRREYLNLRRGAHQLVQVAALPR
jgi:hypothetical protein